MDILLIDDEPELREALAEAMRGAGHAVTEQGDGAAAAKLLIDKSFDLLLSDVRLPGLDGLALLRHVRKEAPLTDFILMTAFADVGEAVAALKEGASDYLTKPFDVEELLHHLTRIDGERTMRRELTEARRALASRGPKSRLIGNSTPMTKINTRIEMIAPSDAATLIIGESGTGKELVARMLHERSARASKPFVAVNCAAFPDTLIEAELFGFERGAFTGAVRKREGRFRAADGGTLFLDEIAELPLPAQAKLLRVLQDGTIEPLGTDQSVKVDVRLVSATHRNLREHVAQGLFREDLFYRINVLDVNLPALRDREGDLPLLIEFFLQGFAKTDSAGNRLTPTLSPDAYAALSAYRFPGNVRELGHAIEHAVVLAGGGEITLDHLPGAIAEAAPSGPIVTSTIPDATDVAGPVAPLAVAAREFEKGHLRRALAATGGKRVKAAELLGISRKSLWEKLRMYDLEEAEAKLAAGEQPKR
ncbi:MAG TPA: sigma-54 dependent transcriptional regulator [Polyangia bacterium]|nr:sigma-54 dependent transcriptional regulator [Polyangia bacterium]